MNGSAPNYRKFSLACINDPQFKHVKLLLYWPLYGLLFFYFERIRIDCTYHPVESILDEYIPFFSPFIIPYFGWFVYLIGGLLLFFFKDVDAFKRCMWFIIITYSVTSAVYFIYPTCQLLRPQVLGDGIFDKIVSGLYVFDTNTNVCPSIHVLGSMAVCFSAHHSKLNTKTFFKALNIAIAVMISFSTVFLKQHSIIDVFWGFILSFAIYPLCFMDNAVSRRLI